MVQVKCPNCEAELEREDHADGGQPTEGLSAIYHCPDCDYEAIWRQKPTPWSERWQVLFPGIGAYEGAS